MRFSDKEIVPFLRNPFRGSSLSQTSVCFYMFVKIRPHRKKSRRIFYQQRDFDAARF